MVLFRTGLLSPGLAASNLWTLHSVLPHAHILCLRYIKTHICRYVTHWSVSTKQQKQEVNFAKPEIY